jgi:quercetin dioxygenase-like cupin family protein
MTDRGRFSTKAAFAILMISAFAVAAVPAAGDTMKDHTVVSSEQVKWGPAPASIPAGAEAAVLYGDPSKDGLFALRLKLPPGYHIPPHWHPKPEIVTVISGTFRLGMGEAADQGKAEALPAGSFFAFPPGMAHYAYADEETVVQLNSTGPWGLTYVNPKDDPRNTQPSQ